MPGLTADAALSNGSAWADYDGDGDLDAFIVNRILNDASGNNVLYRNEGALAFTRLDQIALFIDAGIRSGTYMYRVTFTPSRRTSQQVSESRLFTVIR